MKYKHGKSVHFCAKITQKRIETRANGILEEKISKPISEQLISRCSVGILPREDTQNRTY